MNKQELTESLLDLDEEASLLFDDESIRFSIVIVGGCSLVMLGYSLRATHDIDVLSAPNRLISLQHLTGKHWTHWFTGTTRQRPALLLRGATERWSSLTNAMRRNTENEKAYLYWLFTVERL
jgi:hypothetical protein